MRCYTIAEGKLTPGIVVQHGPFGMFIVLGNGDHPPTIRMFERNPPDIQDDRVHNAYLLVQHAKRDAPPTHFLAKPNNPFDQDVLVRVDTRGQSRGTNTGLWRPIRGRESPRVKLVGKDFPQGGKEATDAVICMSPGQTILIETRGGPRVCLEYDSPAVEPRLLV